jgi:hypothetical protein
VSVAAADGRFLTIWTLWTAERGNTAIMGTLNDAAGRRISSRAFPIVESTGVQARSLAGTDDSFALFWSDGEGGQFLTNLDLEGRVTDTRKLSHGMRGVTWNGSRFLAVSDNTHAIALLDRSGILVTQPAILGKSITGAVAAGDGFVVLAHDSLAVYAYRVAHDGSVIEREIARRENVRSLGKLLAAPATGGDVRLAWLIGTELRTAIFTRAGELGPVRSIPFVGTVALHLMRTANGHVLAYRDGVHAGALELRPDGSVGAVTERVATLTDSMNGEWASNGSVMLLVYLPRDTETTASLAIAADTTAGRPEVLAIEPALQERPVLGAGNGRLLAAWTEGWRANRLVRLVPVEPADEPRPDAKAGAGVLAAPELAWNGTDFLLLTEGSGSSIVAVRVRPDGTPVDLGVRLGFGTTAGRAALAWAGDRWVAVWQGAGNVLQFATVSPAGIASPVRTIVPDTPLPPDGYRYIDSAALAFNGTTLLLAWNENERTYAARLSRDGALLDPTPLELERSGGSLSIATSGSELVVAGNRSVVAIDARPTPMRTIAYRRFFTASGTDITWDGASYALARRYRTTGYTLGLWRFDRELRDVAPPRGVPVLPPLTDGTPSIAAARPSSAAIALQEFDVAGGPRAVVYGEAELAPLPAPPLPPGNVRATRLADGSYEITWETSGGAELYLVTPLGQRFGYYVTAGAPLRVRTFTAHVQVIAVNSGGESAAVSPDHGRRRTSRP